MPVDVSCPDPETLLHFASGQLDQTEAIPITDHIRHCSVCAQSLTAFESKKNQSRDGHEPRQVPTIAEQVELFRLSRDFKSPTATPVNGLSDSSAPTSHLPSTSSWDFLAAPEKTDEIGRLGGYRILSVLGEGGMGVVFKAEDPRLKRLVALKVMKPDKSANDVAHQRFIKEGEAAALLQHDHIVTIYEVDKDGGIPFLAMQFLEGESLDDRLKRVGKLPVGEIIRIARETADGLEAAHKKGLIHRDIKPANIWLETLPGAPALGRGLVGGRVKILDFGLARQVGENVQHLTQTGMVVGTPDYMAPEQARSGQVLDGRCDLFSLGSVMYRMSTGRKPFQGDDVMGTLLALAMEDPSPPRFYNPEIPQELSDMIRWLMAKSPADRPRSAQDVLDSLVVIERNISQDTENFPGLGGESTNERSFRGRGSTTAAPGISSRTSLQPKSAQKPPNVPSLSKFGLSPIEPTRTAPAPALPSPSDKKKSEKEHAKSAPAPALSPLLKDLVNRTESWEAVRPKIEKCPKCGYDRFSSVGWCLSCGYSPKVDDGIPSPKARPLNSGWIILGGIVAVILLTAVCHVTLRVSGQSWIRWVWIETGIGFAGIIVGYIWNYYEVLPYYGDHTGNLTWNPLTLFSAGIHMLPKTRWALALGAWSLTAVAATALFVGDPSYFWTFKVRVPIPSSSPLVFEKSDLHAGGSGSSSAESSKKKSKTTRTFCIVGTLGGEAVVAHHSIVDGSYKYAGRAPLTALAQEKVKQAKPRSEPVISGSTMTGVTWFEPFSWEIEFSKLDDNGVLIEPVLK
jgi:serine/threonine protein kinase